MPEDKTEIATEKEIRIFLTGVMRGDLKDAKPNERMKAAELLLKRFDLDAGEGGDGTEDGFGTNYGIILMPDLTREG